MERCRTQLQLSVSSSFSQLSFVENLLCLHAVVVIYCPDLDDPGNGTKNTNETSCGTTAQFSCDQCYELKRYEQLSCLPNGTWNGEEPNCSC